MPKFDALDLNKVSNLKTSVAFVCVIVSKVSDLMKLEDEGQFTFFNETRKVVSMVDNCMISSLLPDKCREVSIIENVSRELI